MSSPIESPPLVAIIGLTGSGKSTLARLLEKSGKACRVRRQTTRLPRADDDPLEVECLAEINNQEEDVVFPGWGRDLYCVRETRVRVIRAAGLCATVELGDFETAYSVCRAFPPALIVLIERRSVSPASLGELLRERRMPESDLAKRLESLDSDAIELSRLRETADWVLNNDGASSDLESTAKLLLAHIWE